MYYYGASYYGAASYLLTTTSTITGSIAEIQDFLPRGLDNLWYSGCKMSSPGFNVNSTDTVDGKPVIEIFKSTGTQIVYAGATGQNTNVLNITNVAPISNNTTNNNNTNTVIG